MIDRSLERIDIAKLLLYALIFIIAVLIMMFVFMVPSIKEYKSAKIQNNDQSANLTKIEDMYDKEYESLKKLEQANQKILSAITTEFDENKFIALTSKYFDNVKLTKLPISKNDNFIKYELNVTGYIDTPQNFYKFLDFLNDYENIIKVDFPISMRSSDTKKIDTSFNIKVYIDGG